MSQQVTTLEKALGHLRDDRNRVAENLAKGYQTGFTDAMMDKFVKVQGTIEAIVRAIEDEKHLSQTK
jgi:hypothetical protein